MKQKTIFIIVPHLRTGGGQQLAINEAIGLQKRGLNVSLVSLAFREENIFTNIAEKNHLNIVYLDKKNGYSLKALFRLTILLLDKKPDIVHTHLMALPYVIIAAIVMKKTVFYHTVHSLADKEAKAMKGFSSILFKLHIVTPIAISNYCKKTIVDYYQINKNLVPVIKNGIDLNRFRCLKNYSDRDEKRLRIITTGRFEPVKNHEFMINVFSEVANDYLVDFFLLGDGELRANIEEQINNLGLQDKVHILGVKENVEFELNMSHIYLMCSKYEGLPLSVLEALACGLPVVATRAGGTIDIINDSNGILCDVDNKEQVVLALRTLICNKSIRNQMSKMALFSAKQYDIEKCVDSYFDLFVKGVKIL